MGYTHYFEQKKDCPPAKWKLICDAFKQMQATALIAGDNLLIQREDNNASPPLVSNEEIVFNGIGPQGHETFYVPRKLVSSFMGCKTAQKSYDRVVVATLCFMFHLAPGVWDISSDGYSIDWEDGVELARTVIPNCTHPYEEVFV